MRLASGYTHWQLSNEREPRLFGPKRSKCGREGPHRARNRGQKTAYFFPRHGGYESLALSVFSPRAWGPRKKSVKSSAKSTRSPSDDANVEWAHSCPSLTGVNSPNIRRWKRTLSCCSGDTAQLLISHQSNRMQKTYITRDIRFETFQSKSPSVAPSLIISWTLETWLQWKCLPPLNRDVISAKLLTIVNKYV